MQQGRCRDDRTCRPGPAAVDGRLCEVADRTERRWVVATLARVEQHAQLVVGGGMVPTGQRGEPARVLHRGLDEPRPRRRRQAVGVLEQVAGGVVVTCRGAQQGAAQLGARLPDRLGGLVGQPLGLVRGLACRGPSAEVRVRPGLQ
jgi:hypothetical protein